MATRNFYSDGNAAYDIQSFGGVNVVREHEYELPQQPQQQPQQEREARVVKAHSQVPVSSIMGFVAAAALLMLVIFSYVRLYEISSANDELKTELTRIETENTEMKNHYTDIIDLNAVELIATSQLGMQRPAQDQIVYIDLGNADKAVIIDSQGENVLSSAADAVVDTFRYILEYFGFA